MNVQALAASGLRSLRYAREIEEIGQVVAVDNDTGCYLYFSIWHFVLIPKKVTSFCNAYFSGDTCTHLSKKTRYMFVEQTLVCILQICVPASLSTNNCVASQLPNAYKPRSLWFDSLLRYFTIYSMPAQWGCVGIRGLPLSGGPTDPYLEGVPCHPQKKN